MRTTRKLRELDRLTPVVPLYPTEHDWRRFAVDQFNPTRFQLHIVYNLGESS
jgi:hypothetical protein